MIAATSQGRYRLRRLVAEGEFSAQVDPAVTSLRTHLCIAPGLNRNGNSEHRPDTVPQRSHSRDWTVDILRTGTVDIVDIQRVVCHIEWSPVGVRFANTVERPGPIISLRVTKMKVEVRSVYIRLIGSEAFQTSWR